MYLMIRNPGVADHRSFTLIGASATRYSVRPGTIGMFGSGAKASIALLLRFGIRPVVYTGNLRMEFFSKPETVNGQTFNRVCLKYSGQDVDGSSKTTTEDLGFCLEWGVQDWTHTRMAVREFVSNAVDGSIESGKDATAIEFDVVEKPRAKKGHTAVFIPYTPEVEQVYKNLNLMFLHFANPELLGKKILPKREGAPDGNVLIYKKGVLVCRMEGDSVFDYNLGDELTLDESRNANEWDVRRAVARALKNATTEELTEVLLATIERDNVWEGELDPYYLKTDTYEDKEVIEKRKQRFARAWEAVAGKNAVVTSGTSALNSLVRGKGFLPVTVKSAAWAGALESCGILSETKVLSRDEREGKVVTEATEAHRKSVDKVWALFEAFNLTNGKEKPGVKGFTSIMEAEAQTWGYYVPGDTDVYLHNELEGAQLNKVTLEECVHYLTGAVDGSRDLQDFLFRLVTAMAF